MKFECKVTINEPRDTVVKFFKDPEFLHKYQDGFERKELISGIEGEEGAVSKMYYKHGKRSMELTETVMENRLPDYFLGHYHHMHMDNTMRSSFRAINTNTTLYSTEIEYTAFRGFIPKMLAKLFPGMFKKQVQKWLDNFKQSVESTTSAK